VGSAAWPASKISPPRPDRLVSRPRLLARLDAAAAAGQTVIVVAPGGSGKTSLLADWARRAATPVAWYALDRGDRDMRSQLGGLLAAIERARPGRMAAAARALAAGAPEMAVVGLMLGALEGSPLALVLDDYQILDDLAEATELWEHVLRQRPPTLALVLLSRTVPMLGFTVAVAMGTLVGIGRTDLGFDETEASELLRIHGLDTGAAADYAARAEGWATGVLLFARATPDGVRFMHHRIDLLLDHLVAQVLAPLPAALRRFVVESAGLGLVTPDEADGILGRTGSAGWFAQTLARDLFLVREGAAYRFHDLFAEYFTGLLAEEDPERLAAIRRSAAAWWLGHGDLARGLAMLAEAGEWPQLAAALAAHRLSLWSGRLWGTILGYVDRLPPSYRTAALLALGANARAERGEYDEALAFADAGKALAADEAEWVSPALAHAEVLMRAGRPGECALSAGAALVVAERVGHPVAQRRLLKIRGIARLSLGEAEAGAEDLRAALAAYQAAGDLGGSAHVCLSVATLLVEAGTARDAESYLTRAARIWAQQGNRAMLGYVALTRAALAALQHEGIAARARAEEAQVIAAEFGDPLLACGALCALAEALIALRRVGESAAAADQAMELARRMGQAQLLNEALRTRIVGALLARDRGRSRELVEEARTLVMTPVDEAILDWLEGAAALRVQSAARAALLLTRAAERLEAVHRPQLAARAYLLLGEASLDLNVVSRAEAALNRMATVAVTASCEAYLRPIAGMARQAVSAPAYLKRLRQDTRALLARLGAGLPALTVVGSPPGRRPRARTLRLSPFGKGRIEFGRKVVDPRELAPKAREVLFYVGRAGGQATRADLLSVLWEDAVDGPAELWDATRHIRRVLGPESWVVGRSAYRLSPAVIDEERLFLAASERATGTGSVAERLAAGEEALALVGEGGFLEWCESQWVVEARPPTRRLALKVALALSRLYAELGRAEDALAAARRAIALEPLEEEPRRRLIGLLAAADQVDAALREYRAYRDLAREELGVAPSPGLRRLVGGLARE